MCIFIIYLSFKGHLGCFHFLDVMNEEAVDMAEQASVEEGIKSSRHMTWHDIAGSYVNLVLVS